MNRKLAWIIPLFTTWNSLFLKCLHRAKLTQTSASVHTDKVLDDLDNSDDEQELIASYLDSELESESSDSGKEDRASSSSRLSVSSDSNDTSRVPRTSGCGAQNVNNLIDSGDANVPLSKVDLGTGWTKDFTQTKYCTILCKSKQK